MQQLAWLPGWKHLDGLWRMAGAAEPMLLCSLGRCLKTCIGLCTSKPGSERLGLHKLTPLPLLWGCRGSHPQPERRECRGGGLFAGKVMEFYGIPARSSAIRSLVLYQLLMLAGRAVGAWDGLFGWKAELLPCGEGLGNVVVIRNCLVLAAASGAGFGGPRAGPGGGRGCARCWDRL